MTSHVSPRAIVALSSSLLAPLVLPLVLGACRVPSGGAGDDEEDGARGDEDRGRALIPRETGNCDNEDVEGMCEFAMAIRVNPMRARGPAGTALYRIEHDVVLDDGSRRTVTTGYLRIDEADSDRLREYYRSKDPVPCKAHIVRPPCNPSATGSDLDLEPPDFATPERF